MVHCYLGLQEMVVKVHDFQFFMKLHIQNTAQGLLRLPTAMATGKSLEQFVGGNLFAPYLSNILLNGLIS